ncbi:FecCD family ABC transporter permease [Microbacterium ulmi]|uniref:FecCD family ABC transporter permease n=1 Tax=Microbacterium ulmi TaxID=179095 RepID=UPI003C7D72CC
MVHPAARRARLRVWTTFGILTALLCVLIVVSAGTGQLHIPAEQVIGALSRGWNAVVSDIGLTWLRVPEGAAVEHVNGEATLWLVRFPRIVMALLVGAALATAGAVMQGVFRNPLAEPGVIGVSSGAAVGACAAIVFGLGFAGPLTLPAMAFLGGLLATVVVYGSARADGRTEVVTLVLTGIAINAIAGAAIALLTFLGTTQEREQIVFWQLGSLNGSRWQDVLIVLPLTVVGVVGCVLLSRSLDLLSLGERQATHLGLNVERLHVVAIVLIALLTSGAVALCGIISFVGLVVPHLVRMILGPGHRLLVPASAFAGAVLLMGADLVARTAVPYAELPIGMLTALIGGPFFFWLLRRTRRRAGGWG